MQLSGPEGLGAVAIHQSLLAVDLILRLPGGVALQQEREKFKQEAQTQKDFWTNGCGSFEWKLFENVNQTSS